MRWLLIAKLSQKALNVWLSKVWWFTQPHPSVPFTTVSRCEQYSRRTRAVSLGGAVPAVASGVGKSHLESHLG